MLNVKMHFENDMRTFDATLTESKPKVLAF